MAAEDSWATDTVALGDRKSRRESRQPPSRGQGPRRGREGSVTRVLLACAAAAVVVVVLAATLDSGSDSLKAPIRDVGGPAPRIVSKQSTPTRPREPNRVARRHVGERAKGRLKAKRKPKASVARHQLPWPEPIVEAASEPEPRLQAEVTSPAPTSPAVEFGM